MVVDLSHGLIYRRYVVFVFISDEPFVYEHTDVSYYLC